MKQLDYQYGSEHDQLENEFDGLMTDVDGILGELEGQFESLFDAQCVLSHIFLVRSLIETAHLHIHS